jgi:hypothetical protein
MARFPFNNEDLHFKYLSGISLYVAQHTHYVVHESSGRAAGHLLIRLILNFYGLVGPEQPWSGLNLHVSFRFSPASKLKN